MPRRMFLLRMKLTAESKPSGEYDRPSLATALWNSSKELKLTYVFAIFSISDRWLKLYSFALDTWTQCNPDDAGGTLPETCAQSRSVWLNLRLDVKGQPNSLRHKQQRQTYAFAPPAPLL